MPNPFTSHPHAVGETYFEHSAFACRYGIKMAAGGIAAILHGLFPFLFRTTASRITRELNAALEASSARAVVEERAGSSGKVEERAGSSRKPRAEA